MNKLWVMRQRKEKNVTNSKLLKTKRNKTSSVSGKTGDTGETLRLVGNDNGFGDGDENEKP
jgi:hypothetical protein